MLGNLAKASNLRLLLAVCWLGGASAFAHPGGHSFGPPAKPEDIKVRAADVLSTLVERKKLDETWKGLPTSEPVKTDVGGGEGWIVSVKNPQATDKEKATVYFFFSIDGQPLGANHTGK